MPDAINTMIPALAKSATLAALPAVWGESLTAEIRGHLDNSGARLVVLDDDPTGTQTVHDLPVLTTWGVAELEREFAAGTPVFYVLTNSRSLPAPAAARLIREIAANLRAAARQAGVSFSVVARGDSTLRGHFPLETDVLAEVLGHPEAVRLIVPCFEAGGRHTIGDVHYVAEDDRLVPSGQTAFARDAAFGYRSSNLRDWVAEKTGGNVPAESVASISIEELRIGGPAVVHARLTALPAGAVCVVNAVVHRDLEVLVLGLLRAEADGRKFICRTAASFVAARAGLAARPLLTGGVLALAPGAGLTVVGSYVPKTTVQLAALRERGGMTLVEVAVPDLLAREQRAAAVARARDEVEASLRRGADTVLATSRELVAGDDAARSLDIGAAVSSALVEIVSTLSVRPRYLIAKGGITSSDLATRALGLRRAMVAGQLLPGVPVWQAGEESRWPGLVYVVFPGNVGGADALVEACAALTPASATENFQRHGEAGELSAGYVLRAGPLTMEYDHGDLRYIKLGGREIVRRIYIAVRDRNWGTVPVALTPVSAEVEADSFAIAYDAVARQDEIDFRWRATIRGTAEGQLEFRLAGAAHSDFLRNRIGFCVLHPPRECAGARCRVRLADGRVVESTLPRAISPANPFSEFRSFAHEVAPGTWCALEFEGDEFEMEDQRNWADASFKTFCTPLSRPYPVAIAKGEQVRQAIALRVEGESVVSAVEAASDAEVRIEPATAPRRRLPALGLAVASDRAALTPAEMERLRALRPAHLRIDLRPREDDCARKLRSAAALAVPLEIALHLTNAAEIELGVVSAALRAAQPSVARWLVFHVEEHSATHPRWVELARAQLGRMAPAPILTGTDYWFAQLNRARPPREGIDGVCFSLNPQVHASDRASLVETLAMHADLIASAREFCGALPISVTPVTLRMRNNPAATGAPRATPAGELPASVDPRQLSLFGAAWTLGSVKHLAESGVASATYYETTGWRGVMETEAGPALPARFPSVAGAVFPLYHVLCDVNEWAGAEVVPCVSSDGLRVEALLLEREGRRRLCCANLTPEPQTVRFAPAITEGRSARGRRLSMATVAEATLTPDRFRAQCSAVALTNNAVWRLRLEPFELVTLDLLS